MRHRFKGKKSFKKNIFKVLFVLFILIFSFFLTFKWLFSKIDLNLSQEKYINYLVHDSFGSYSLGDIASMTSTQFLLKYSFGIDKIDTVMEIPKDPLEIPAIEIDPPKEENNLTLPIVYIYNTHQTEGYKNAFLETFNINNTVMFASYIFKEYLNDLGISAIVEENSVADILNVNGWKYGSSYKASRILMESAKKNNPSLEYFIDIHRDAASYERTTTTISDKKYAKVLFVIGLEHEAYEKNLAFANALNEKIREIDPSLTRGVMQKEGKGVNGKYNQDFSSHGVLIEVGGQYNSIEEVNNTLKVIAEVLFSYIEEAKSET